jgi:divalent metal cation (Fe/Co/Zn/Cd) transporter
MGVGANVLLAAFKAGVGLASGSIAILMDAVNNLTDVLSSVVTIVGTHLSHARPTANTPSGTGASNTLPPSSSPSSC